MSSDQQTGGVVAFFEEVRARFPDILDEVPDAYITDPRKLTPNARAAGLVRPVSTEQVSQLVRLASQHRVPVIPYSGGTGLVGGQVQSERDDVLLLSLEKINYISEPNPVDRSMLVGAGAILADVQAKARAVGLFFPLSLAAEGSCRIGGNLATNAGGVNVLRYGNARDLCLGVEAVMPDGSIYHGLRPLRKDNTGYDLRHLLIGSEGTLGVITAARLKLFSAPRTTVTAIFEIPGPQSAIDLLTLLRHDLGDAVTALELIDRTGIDFLEETWPDLHLPPTGQSPWLALVEVAMVASGDLRERFEACLAKALEGGIVTDGHIAQSETQRDVIWAMREAIPEGNRRIGAVSSHDISVPVAALPDFVIAGRKVIDKVDPDLRINCFGHVGDGNLHYNVFPPAGGRRDDWLVHRHRVKSEVHALVDDFGGSISAEHGVGRHKRDDLARFADPAKFAAIKAIKAALDPKGIMNPGAVIEAQTDHSK